MLYVETSNIFAPWAGESINGKRYPPAVENWSDTQLAEVGLYRPQEAEPVPGGKIVISRSVQRVDGVVRWVNELADAPEPDPADIVEGFRVAIQGHVDATAIGRRYDSGNSLATYVTSTVAQWASEAETFIAWRDAVWAYAYAELDRVLAGERDQPTIAEFLGELPPIEWPE